MPRLLAVNTLIVEVREIDGALVHGVGGAAVFVHARAHVKAGWSDVDRTVGRPLDDHIPAALRCPAFEPIHIMTVELNLIQPKRAGGHARGGEGRWPGAVWKALR